MTVPAVASAPADITAMPPTSSYVPAASGLLRLQVGEHEVRLIFTNLLTVPANAPSGLDTWLVEVQASGTPTPAILEHRTPHGVQPHPHNILATLGSDVSLSLQMPAFLGDAVDWLFNEGYATLPSEALALRSKLLLNTESVATLLSGSGIALDAFAAYAATLPLVRQPARAFA